MGLGLSVLWSRGQANGSSSSSAVISDTLEQLADEALRLDAFEKQAKQYNIITDSITPDLPMEEASFEDEYYSGAEKESEMPIKRALRAEKAAQASAASTSPIFSFLSSSTQSIAPPEANFKWQKGPLLGSGSFGRVHLGLSLETGELMAIKQVELAADKLDGPRQEVIALQHEIEVLKSLKHENIVQYLGSSVEDDVLNIFLEYVPGGSIASLLRRFGPLNESIIRLYTKQILHGLQYLHIHKIIHRDIKGANILVDSRGGIKLADFGASKKLEHLAAGGDNNSLKGTLYWMAPEVIRQAGCGRQADIWSLGCTVIEMATGKPPWSDTFPEQVSAFFHIATSSEIPKLPDCLSEEAKDFLNLCFRRDPKERPNARTLLRHPFVTTNVTLTSLPKIPSSPANLHAEDGHGSVGSSASQKPAPFSRGSSDSQIEYVLKMQRQAATPSFGAARASRSWTGDASPPPSLRSSRIDTPPMSGTTTPASRGTEASGMTAESREFGSEKSSGGEYAEFSGDEHEGESYGEHMTNLSTVDSERYESSSNVVEDPTTAPAPQPLAGSRMEFVRVQRSELQEPFVGNFVIGKLPTYASPLDDVDASYYGQESDIPTTSSNNTSSSRSGESSLSNTESESEDQGIDFGRLLHARAQAGSPGLPTTASEN